MWKMYGSSLIKILGRAAACAVLLFFFAGCVEKGGVGVVLSKEFIPAAPPEQEVLKEHQFRFDQWKVLVQMVEDRRKVNVVLDQPEWEKINVGDRVKVRYSQGKYTYVAALL